MTQAVEALNLLGLDFDLQEDDMPQAMLGFLSNKKCVTMSIGTLRGGGPDIQILGSPFVSFLSMRDGINYFKKGEIASGDI